jgi:LGFP repeat
MSAISDKFQLLQSQGVAIGNAIGEEQSTPNNLGQYQEYEHGAIFYNSCFGACWMTEKVMKKWKSDSVASTLAHNGSTVQAYLGLPMIDTAGNDSEMEISIFEQGMIVCYSTGDSYSAGDSIVVYGPIYNKYLSSTDQASDTQSICTAFPNWVGQPLEDVSVDKSGSGLKGRFKHADIYWKPELGAFMLRDSIRDRYNALQDDTINLGYPTTDEGDIRKDDVVVGKGNNFQFGWIFWSEKTGAWAVSDGSYLAEYGGPTGELGFPTSNHISPYPFIYGFNNFEHGILVWRRLTNITHKITGLELKVSEIHTKGKADARGANDPYLEIGLGSRLSTPEPLPTYYFPNIAHINQGIETGDEGRLYYKNMNSIIVPEDQQTVCIIPINDGNQVFTVNIQTWDYDAGSDSNDDNIGGLLGTYDVETLWNTTEPIAIARNPDVFDFNESGDGTKKGATKVIFSLTPV